MPVTREELERRRANGGMSHAEFVEAVGTADADGNLPADLPPLGEEFTGPERIALRPGKRYDLK